METLLIDPSVLNISTRPNRRKAVALAIFWLCQICIAEKAYRNRIPTNLQGGDAYAAAEESIELIGEAIDNLFDAY